jgi:hypothetical protein
MHPADLNAMAISCSIVAPPLRWGEAGRGRNLSIANPLEGVMKTMRIVLCGVALLIAGSLPASAQSLNPTHYQCYNIKQETPFEPREVRLVDQFGRSSVKVVVPVWLCTPTKKNNERITDKTTHLLCYQIEGGALAGKNVLLKNQFGKFKAFVEQSQILCVPTLKKVLSTTN